MALTLRNLTQNPFTIKTLETFEDPNNAQSKSNVFPPDSRNVAQHALSFHHENLDILVKPFESFMLRAKGMASSGKSIRSPSIVMRITIESDMGERHRIDTNPLYTQKSSKPFTNLIHNPSRSYTALYHPAKPVAHLVVHTNHLHNYARWMESLPSNLPLSALSIPGTHNSHTHYRGLPSVRCQVSSIKVQLENGIRFLDVRVQPSHATDTQKKDLYLVHGAFPISLTGVKYFAPILETCYAFLAANPSETILLSLKREGVGSATDEHLAAILENHYIAPNPSRWYTGNRIPYLGDVRGKIILVRRYDIQKPSTPLSISSKTSSSSASFPVAACGLDATEWPHNSTHAVHGPFCVQDWCEVLHPSSIPSKLQYANEHLIRSSQTTAFIPGVNTDDKNPIPPGPLHLNFLSGSNFWNKGTWPEKIAKVVNRGIEEWICMGHALEEPVVAIDEPDRARAVDVECAGGTTGGTLRRKAKGGDGGTGVVIMDNVGEGGDWDLVGLIVGLNMGVLMAMHAIGTGL
ncbi:unnamed protein product [Periconia digitata]|uniref:Phosphatidylinositol-specific phospholipase C X domain-containing protein n=1 Tax=Periconia digitata TaxID=1303443 RepID=A0A9W4XPK7_9PLEO|nr:unnamed protein product [Periconia digitata]